MSTLAETRMDKGLFVIVPLVNDESAEEVKAWHKSDPKRYQLRVLDKNNSLMQEEIPGADPKMEWTPPAEDSKYCPNSLPATTAAEQPKTPVVLPNPFMLTT